MHGRGSRITRMRLLSRVVATLIYCRSMLRTPFRRRFIGCVLGGVVVAATACSPGSGSPSGSSDTTAAIDSSTTAPGLACEEFRSTTEIGPAVSVTVRHEGAQPVYFLPQGCAAIMSFEVTSLDLDTDVPNARSDCLPELCDDFMVASDCFPGCPNCAPPGSGRIDPGATGTGEWSGTWLVPLEMNSDCVSHNSCVSTCQRADQAPAGRYTVGLTIFRTCDGGCECDGDDDGVCSLYGGTFLGYPQTFVATVDYPNQTTAEIVIVD